MSFRFFPPGYRPAATQCIPPLAHVAKKLVLLKDLALAGFNEVTELPRAKLILLNVTGKLTSFSFAIWSTYPPWLMAYGAPIKVFVVRDR